MPYITFKRELEKYAFTVLGTFVYITTSYCEAGLLLFPKSIIDDIEENLRT